MAREGGVSPVRARRHGGHVPGGVINAGICNGAGEIRGRTGRSAVLTTAARPTDTAQRSWHTPHSRPGQGAGSRRRAVRGQWATGWRPGEHEDHEADQRNEFRWASAASSEHPRAAMADRLTQDMIADGMARAEKVACRPGDDRCYPFPDRLEVAQASLQRPEGTRRVAVVSGAPVGSSLPTPDEIAGTYGLTSTPAKAGCGGDSSKSSYPTGHSPAGPGMKGRGSGRPKWSTLVLPSQATAPPVHPGWRGSLACSGWGRAWHALCIRAGGASLAWVFRFDRHTSPQPFLRAFLGCAPQQASAATTGPRHPEGTVCRGLAACLATTALMTRSADRHGAGVGSPIAARLTPATARGSTVRWRSRPSDPRRSTQAHHAARGTTAAWTG